MDVLKGTGRAVRWNLSLVVLAAAAGCAPDLHGIRDFAVIAADSARYEDLVEDYVGFPERKKRYESESLYPQLEAESQERKAQRALLLLRFAIIPEYMEALGALAADDLVVFDKQVEGLTNSVSGLPGVSRDDVQTYGRLGKALTQAATNHWRRRELRQLIVDSHEPFGRALGTLERFVQIGPIMDAEDEQRLAARYYGDAIRSSGDSGARIALAEWRRYRLAEIDRRSASAKAYILVLETIEDGHQKLYAQRDHLDARELTAEIGEIAKQLKDLYAVVRRKAGR